MELIDLVNSNVISDGSEVVKKGVPRNFAKFIGKHLCQSLFFDSSRPQTSNFIKKETLAQVFSCECEIYKNTFFTEHFWMAASYSYCSYSGYYCHGFALLDLFLLSTLFVLQWHSLYLGDSNLVVGSVSFDSPSKSKGDAHFHRTVYDYSLVDWDGLHDHLRDNPREDIFNPGASAAEAEFCEWLMVGIDAYIPLFLIVNIRSSHINIRSSP